jgi:hypothetical protein
MSLPDVGDSPVAEKRLEMTRQQVLVHLHGVGPQARPLAYQAAPGPALPAPGSGLERPRPALPAPSLDGRAVIDRLFVRPVDVAPHRHPGFGYSGRSSLGFRAGQAGNHRADEVHEVWKGRGVG